MNLLWIFLTALLVAVADSILKEISTDGSVVRALLNPWMLAVLVLYFVQIVVAIVVFNNKGELAIYANLYVVFYALLGITFGILFFKESLSIYQMIGAVLAIIAAILLNIQ